MRWTRKLENHLELVVELGWFRRVLHPYERTRSFGVQWVTPSGYVKQLQREGWWDTTLKLCLWWFELWLIVRREGSDRWSPVNYRRPGAGGVEIWRPVGDTLTAEDRFARQHPELSRED